MNCCQLTSFFETFKERVEGVPSFTGRANRQHAYRYNGIQPPRDVWIESETRGGISEWFRQWLRPQFLDEFLTDPYVALELRG